MRCLLLALGLVIACAAPDAPTLSTTDQAIVGLSEYSYDFGSLQVDSGQSQYHSFTIYPGPGESYDQVYDMQYSCPDFLINTGSLPATVYRSCYYDPWCYGEEWCCQTQEYQTHDFSAAFKPNVAGNTSCVIYINTSSGVETVSLYGYGTPPPIAIHNTPQQINFGDVRKGDPSDSVTVMIRNTGGQTINVTQAYVSGAPFDIASGNMAAHSLPVGAEESFTVYCEPDSTGNSSGYFRLDSNAPQVNIPLYCNGVDSNVALSPSPATIPTTRVGEPMQTNISIYNYGTAPMQLESVAVTGTDLVLMSAPPAGSYGYAQGGTAVVRFGAAAKGTQTGTLTVTYDGGQTRVSQISARALATSMALTPDGDVAFGPVCAGQKKDQSFTLIANEEGSFNVTSISAPAAPFSLGGMPAFPAPVAGNGTSMVTFTVSASPAVEGMQTSSMTLSTNIPNSTPRTINLSVDALKAGVSPSPASLDFGSAPENTTTIGKAIHLSNCSGTAASYANARIEGVDASDFAIVLTPDTANIPPNDDVKWLVVMSAKAKGNKMAEFVVEHDGATTRVPLMGEGLGPPDPIDPPDDPTEELSYYACSTGSAQSLWPLGFVLLVWRRRRHR